MINPELICLEKQFECIIKIITDNDLLQTNVRAFINPVTKEFIRLESPKLPKEVYEFRDLLIKKIQDVKYNELQRQADVSFRSEQ